MLINIYSKQKELRKDNPIEVFQNNLEEIEEVTSQALNDLNTRVTNNTSEIVKSKIKVINKGTSDTTLSINPNILYVWGKVSALTLQLLPGEEDTYNNYMFQFESGDTPTTITINPAVEWAEPLNIKANTKYQVSILNNIGLIVGV